MSILESLRDKMMASGCYKYAADIRACGESLDQDQCAKENGRFRGTLNGHKVFMYSPDELVPTERKTAYSTITTVILLIAAAIFAFMFPVAGLIVAGGALLTAGISITYAISCKNKYQINGALIAQEDIHNGKIPPEYAPKSDALINPGFPFNQRDLATRKTCAEVILLFRQNSPQLYQNTFYRDHVLITPL